MTSTILNAILGALTYVLVYALGYLAWMRRAEKRQARIFEAWQDSQAKTFAAWEASVARMNAQMNEHTAEAGRRATIAIDSAAALLTTMSANQTTFHDAFHAIGKKLRSGSVDERRVAEVAAALLTHAYTRVSDPVSAGLDAALAAKKSAVN